MDLKNSAFPGIFFHCQLARLSPTRLRMHTKRNNSNIVTVQLWDGNFTVSRINEVHVRVGFWPTIVRDREDLRNYNPHAHLPRGFLLAFCFEQDARELADNLNKKFPNASWSERDRKAMENHINDWWRDMTAHNKSPELVDFR